MEGGIYVILSLLVSLCVVGNIECNEPQPEYRTEDQQKYSEGDYMDYSSNEQQEIMCYSCHFEIRDGHESGMPGCDKSFIKAGIPTVSCPGPCATIYQMLGEKQFLITRNCVPSCKERRTESGTVECCHTPMCNAGSFQATSCVVITVLCSLVALILRR